MGLHRGLYRGVLKNVIKVDARSLDYRLMYSMEWTLKTLLAIWQGLAGLGFGLCCSSSQTLNP